MPVLTSGLVIAGAYAHKIRRTIFAQLRDEVKAGHVSSQEIARAAGELNSTLYRILVERLRIDKGDVVRIRVEYRIENGKIVWVPSKLSVEIFRRDREAEEALKQQAEVLWREAVGRGIEYQVAALGETLDGDVIYSLRLRDEEAGALALTRLDSEVFVKRGAVIHPSPMIFERIRIPVSGEESLESVISRVLSEAQKTARHVSEEEARKIANYLRERVKAAPLAERGEDLQEAS